jgi:hypothetical protein
MKKTLLLALAVIAVGCDEPAGPPMDVAITATTKNLVLNETTQRWTCNFTMTATANGGSEEDFAMWQESEVSVWLADGSRLGPWFLTETDVLDIWESDRIRTGDVLISNRTGEYSQMNEVRYTFRLQMPDLSLKSIPVFVDCS